MPKAERIQVILDCGILGDIWFTPEDAAQMTDDAIVEVLHEDKLALIESATYKIVRHPVANAKHLREARET